MNPNTLYTRQKAQIKTLYFATLILLLPIISAFYFLSIQKEELVLEVDFVNEPLAFQTPKLQNIDVSAYSVFVMNLQTKDILYEKNSGVLLPLASITKLVTAKVASDLIKTPTVTISKMKDFPQYGDFSLSEGQRWNTQDLITYTLLTSSNDGAHSLLESVSSNKDIFTQRMNQLASSIGLTKTFFYNETGLDNDVSGVPGSKSTAKEVGDLLSYLIEKDFNLYEETKYINTNVQSPDGMRIATNTNSSADQIIGLMMSKTGYTDLAGGNLAIVADMGLNDLVAFVVLKSSRESRFEDVLELQEEYFAQVRETLR